MKGRYHHREHAGNFADLFKHCVLAELLQLLRRTCYRLHYTDTHTGLPLYRLPAMGTFERKAAGTGLDRCQRRLPASRRRQISLPRNSLHTRRTLGTHYRGSGMLAAELLRPEDRLTLIELEPDNAAALQRHFAYDRRVTVLAGDGFRIAPESPRSSGNRLYFIDPPYMAMEEEWKQANLLAARLLARNTGSCIAVWYPVRNQSGRHLPVTEVNPNAPYLRVKLRLGTSQKKHAMNACGMVIFRPPRHLDSRLRLPLSTLRTALSPQARVRFDHHPQR